MSLSHLIHTHPLIDNHAHAILSHSHATDYASYPFEQITSEAQGPALHNAHRSLPLLRAINDLAGLYGCPDVVQGDHRAEDRWEKLLAARAECVKTEAGYEELVRRCLHGTQVLLLDDLLPGHVQEYTWHDRFTPSQTKRIVRIEVLAGGIIDEMKTGSNFTREEKEDAFSSFAKSFADAIQGAIADAAVVGFKSVICYRTGLDVGNPDEASVMEAFVRTASMTGTCRVEDKSLNDWILLRTLDLLKQHRLQHEEETPKPVQLHTGLGDADINLLTSNPAHLQPVIARYPEVAFVLLHSAYPYTREAGYLACVYDNVYLDLGEVFPMVSRDAQQAILRESLEIVPTSRLLWSTDGHYFPETFWLANRQFRLVLDEVLTEYVRREDLSLLQAMTAAADILFHNSNRLYGLNLSPDPVMAGSTAITANMVATSDTTSATSGVPWLAKLAKLNVKFVWVQWLDYTATTRVRMFPVREFLRLAHQQRRLGIARANLRMIQTDAVAPGSSCAGQFYLQPDLATLAPNLAFGPVAAAGGGRHPSASATVMTFWRGEDGVPLEGCPRTTLQRITRLLQTEHGLDVLCGCEIEVVLMRFDSVYNVYVPAATNHSWSQMTRETRPLVPLLEEIADTLASLDIELQQFHAESSPGQFEFVLPPSSPLQAIDTLLRARAAIVHVAEQHGLRATLHPRPYTSAAGTAAHTHISISKTTPDMTLSSSISTATEQSFLAGLLAHLPSVMAFTLSQEESYARVQAGIWAGGEWVAWGTQNRETPLRKISPAHWEVKTVDGLANMYLALAALLAAGYLGLKHSLPLTIQDCQGDSSVDREKYGITTPLPNTLQASLAALQADVDLHTLLGKEFVQDYIATKRTEREMLLAMPDSERRLWLIERY
ncbi:hypothetical protein ASPZODRAFT_135007 [Penicilliopsis zonata CBS 506.65]|uniref:Glutamine synthetase n=1 Tax=Penicilliopsis zonata CBS 506.65 TaxID=1073090 RepID=A0A1L9SAR8_9EURO|nr:hypothetical protein ASPZODRAFT_135007 [Penicilliopsis zonata CBS 506.65]OJJ44217.1 hypothetical protein ASPZODRAFT_135007 [Penicilliopsis zonata CBS 506.65]